MARPALLQEKKVGYIKIDGHTGSEKRKELCDQFQTSDAKRVALLSITAARFDRCLHFYKLKMLQGDLVSKSLILTSK